MEINSAAARRSLPKAGIDPMATPVGYSPIAELMPWKDRRWLSEFPQLSFAERDRRWTWIRAMMEREGVDALIISTRPGHDQFSHYVTNDGASVVVFPLRGEPASFVLDPLSPRGRVALRKAEQKFGKGWVNDWRFAQTVADVATFLRERGLDRGRLGSLGWPTSAPIGPYMERGGRPWNVPRFWRDLANSVPRVEWFDMFWQFVGEASIKSSEELAMFHKAALLAEMACLAFVDAIRPGATLAQAQLAAAEQVILHGGHTNCATGVLENHRPLRVGDSANTEMIAFVGDVEAQAGYTVCLGEPTQSMQLLIETTERSYRAGLEKCRPGVSLRELEEAMEEPYSRGGYWHLAPLYHGLNPMVLQGTTGKNIGSDLVGLADRFFNGKKPGVYHQFGGSFVLQEGMMIHLEPNGRRGRDNVFLGVNVLIGRDGPVLYSESSSRVHIKPT